MRRIMQTLIYTLIMLFVGDTELIEKSATRRRDIYIAVLRFGSAEDCPRLTQSVPRVLKLVVSRTLILGHFLMA